MSAAKKKKKKSSSGATRKRVRGGAPNDNEAPQAAPSRQARPTRMVEAEKVAAHRAKERRKTVVYRSLIAIVLLITSGIVGYAVYRSQIGSGLPNIHASPSRDHYSVPKGADKAGITVGESTAPVTVDLYVDYQCPHCRALEAVASPYIHQYLDNGTIKAVYHPIAILSGYSLWGSAASGCAADQDKFLDYSTKLFEKQSEMRPSDLVTLGQSVGITSPQFRDCVEKVKYKNWTLGMRGPAEDKDIHATPTVFVNGKEVTPGSDRETEKEYVDQIRDAIDTSAKTATHQ